MAFIQSRYEPGQRATPEKLSIWLVLDDVRIDDDGKLKELKDRLKQEARRLLNESIDHNVTYSTAPARSVKAGIAETDKLQVIVRER